MKYFTVIIFLLLSLTTFAQESVRPWIGIQIDQAEGGVLVKGAMKDTPGERAGFKNGDVIQSIDDKKINSPKELIETVIAKGVGNDVKIKYMSEGKQKETILKLEAMPGLTEMANKMLLKKDAPEILAKILSGGEKGGEFKLSEHKGKVKVLEFWATWCMACLGAHPVISEFAAKNKDIEVIAISDEDIPVIKKYLTVAKKMKAVGEDVLFIKSEKDKAQGDYFVSAFPMFILIDKENVVRHLTVGAGRNLTELLEKAKTLK